MNEIKILIVEDDGNSRVSLERALQLYGYTIFTAVTVEEARSLCADAPEIDVVISDYLLDGENGLTLLGQIKEKNCETICILVTAYGTMEVAVEAMKLGAYDVLAKPLNVEKLDLVIRKAVSARNLEDENKRYRSFFKKKYSFDQFVGNSAEMEEVRRKIDLSAPSDASILITGESGVGKELAARAIHYQSKRFDRTMTSVNCAALTETLAESELFGHERGAFTGAAKTHRGVFESTNGGTLFLDEIAELNGNVQSKLLRVLQEKEIVRVGSSKPIMVDVRIIAATNVDLGERVRIQRFREDLFYRIKVIVIDIPPLRKRREDILLLIDHFLDHYRRIYAKTALVFGDETREHLLSYNWPGNVRELKNCIHHAVVMAQAETIALCDLPHEMAVASREKNENKEILSLDDLCQRHIVATLARLGNDKRLASQQLGIGLKTLYRKLHEYNLL